MSIDEFEDKSYGEGYSACADNASLNDNPYVSGTIDAQSWEAGWRHYDADYNPAHYERIGSELDKYEKPD